MPERGVSRIGKDRGQLSVVVGTVQGNRSQANSRSKKLHRAVAVAMSAALLSIGSRATRAASDYWDGDGIGTVGGGPGQWELTLKRFGASPAATDYAPFVNNDTATFTGSGGVVNITAPVTGNLDIQSDGYFFELAGGVVGAAFAWGSTLPSVNVVNGASTEMRFTLAGATAGLIKTGGGTFGFSAALLASGAPVTVNGGTLLYTSRAATIGPSLVTIAPGATLSLGKFNDSIGALSGAGTIVLGTLNNAHAANGSNPSSIWGSTLTVNSNNATSTFSGNIIDDGGALTNAPFSGGHLVKAGTGTLTLAGTNTFRGPMLLSAGNLVVQGGNALPDAAPTILNASTTLVMNSNETIGSLASPSTATTATLNIGAGTLTLGGDNLNNEFAGPVQGSGNIVKVGTGKQFLIGTITTSTYTGKYVIQGGAFGFGADLRLGVAPTALTANYITLDGGTLAPQTAAAGANITLQANRGITVTANGGGLYYNNPAANNLSVQGPITGSGTITRGGAALINLQGNNSGVTGQWLVTDGITNIGSGGVVFGNTANLGAMPAGTASWDISQARLQLATNNVTGGAQTYTIASKPGGTFSYGPGVVMTIARGGNTNFTVTLGDPAAASSTLIRKTNGTMLINAASGPLTLGGATSEQILINGGVPTVAINDGADTIVPGILLTTADNSTEGFHATYDNTFGVQVAPQSLKIDINTCNSTDLFAADTTTTNTLTMSAVGVYGLKVGTGGTGATIALAGGTLNIGGGASTDPAVAILNTNSQVTATPSGTSNFGDHEAIIAAFGTATWNGVITSSQGLTKMGYGNLVLTVSTTLNYPGATRIEQGTLTLGAVNQLPATTDLIFAGAPSTTAAANPTLAVGGRVLNINSLNTLNNANAIGTSAGGPVINLGNNGMIQINGSGTSSFNGQITNGAGTSTVWNAGPGVLTLGIPDALSSDRSATMSYDKLWVSNGGTIVLPISDFNVYPRSAGTPVADAFLLDNGTLRFPSILGVGIGADTTSLGGNFILNTSRGIRINAGGGTIDVQNPYQQISLAGNGPLSGTATLTKAGAGILLLPNTAQATQARLKLRVTGGSAILPADASLGPAPTVFQADSITLDGGALDGAAAGIIVTPNRGITVGPNGGELRGGIQSIQTSLSGSGPLRLASPGGVSKGFSRSSDGTAPGGALYTGAVTIAQEGAVFATANNALGTGTITNDPAYAVTFGTNFQIGPVTFANNFVINPGRPWDFETGSAAGEMTLTGVISGGGTILKGMTGIGPGPLTLANSANSFTGSLTISAGLLYPLVNGALGNNAAPMIINGIGSLGFKGNVNYTNPKPVFISGASASGAIANTTGNNTFAGAITLTSSATVQVAAGTLTLTNDTVGANDSILTKSGTGLLTMKNVRTGGLSITAGNVKIIADSGPGGVSNPRTLSIAANTKLDLNDNKLITTNAVGTWNGSTYTDVTGLVVSGRNGGTWSGNTGIITSQTSAIVIGHSSYTSLGVATAAETKGITASDTAVWAGQTVSGTDTLVMYTYAGDATLDGRINVDDYNRIDTGVGMGVSGWSNGDFNYDGKINIDDYTIIDANIGPQGPQFFSAGGTSLAASLNGVSAVPEPAAGLSVLAFVLAQTTRRRRSKQTISAQNEPEKL
jgi:autotransporter-associated beta strand protein